MRRRPAFALLATLLAACPDGGPTAPSVAEVQMSTTYSNPRVGESSTVSANPVTSGGVTVQGVTCTFASGSPLVAAVNPTTGAVTALTVGTAVITATCGNATGTLTITVRPQLRILTLSANSGPGSGSLFANPPNGLGYEDGTSVTLTATPLSGSRIEAWTGDCQATAATSNTCTLIMSANRTAGVVFKTFEAFATTSSFGGALGNVANAICTWQISATITSMTLNLEVRSTGQAGTGTESSSIGISVVSVNQPGATCTSSPFSESGTGNLTLNGNTVTGTLSNTSGRHTVAINATRSGTTLSGTATVTQVTQDNNGVQYTTNKSFPFTATKQP